MADGLTLSGLRDAYAAASPARKLLWAALILLLLALPPALFWKSAQAPREYHVLYAKLSDKDGGEVVEALERLKIPYRLSEPDGLVQVPSEQLHVARYKLAAQGLPRGDKSAADDTGPRFGLSPFQEQLGYQRALEAELARSVQSVEAIEAARVHLALPKQSAFLRERIPPAATVLVKLKPGARLDAQQVQALRLIVAGGVPGMSPGEVSIVDQHGAVLDAGATTAQPADSQPLAAETAPLETPAATSPSPAPLSRPAAAAPARPDFPEINEELLPVYAGLALSLLALISLLVLRARRRRQARQEEELAAQAQEPGEVFDARLEALRQGVLADPRIAASVVKLWMQNP